MSKFGKTELWVWAVAIAAAALIGLWFVRPDWMRAPVQPPTVETPNAGKNPRMMP